MDRVDDKDLGDERLLYRRIIPGWIIHEDGEYRPQSVALVDRHTHEVSVFVADLTTISAIMQDYPEQSLVEFQAALPRKCDGIVSKTPENPDPAHRVLCYPTGNKMVKAAKIIATNCRWVVLRPPTHLAG
jgi:hypothetical protein